MVYQVGTGVYVLGREIKVPQVFIPRIVRSTIITESADLTQLLTVIHNVAPTSPVTDEDVAAVNEMVSTWAAEQLVTLMATSLAVHAVHTRSMEGLIVPSFTSYEAGTGTREGDQLPLGTSCFVELTTGLTGRRNKGGIHLPPATESDNTDTGHPVSGYLTDVGPVVNNLITASIAIGYPLVIASYRYGTWSEVRGFVISPFWGTMASRRQGHGR